MQQSNFLVWIDLEMTGLNEQQDTILEIATFITDNNLQIVATGPDLVIHQSQERLSRMQEVVENLHRQSGLLDLVTISPVNLQQAEEQTLAFLMQYCVPQTALLCGNSVWKDKAFLAQHMPRLHDFFYYRIVDVSSVKELINRWYPGQVDKNSFKKSEAHRASDDILESIEELRYYRKTFFK